MFSKIDNTIAKEIATQPYQNIRAETLRQAQFWNKENEEGQRHRVWFLVHWNNLYRPSMCLIIITNHFQIWLVNKSETLMYDDCISGVWRLG